MFSSNSRFHALKYSETSWSKNYVTARGGEEVDDFVTYRYVYFEVGRGVLTWRTFSWQPSFTVDQQREEEGCNIFREIEDSNITFFRFDHQIDVMVRSRIEIKQNKLKLKSQHQVKIRILDFRKIFEILCTY